ncbi:YSIRK-type signal peptide-containing protein [Staphylococcus pettenkoferi]|nr:YSIRK-type signal peptide-containing protein [Staphylococcus pettenkoferi]MCY1627181.1 YSIRK-type signal peptide-containing protein [Staphylococcus pettenkoferi]
MRKNSPQFMNKKHNYSIRKFTFGTASIVVGATLFFGAGQAHAAEQGQQSDDTTTTTQSSQDNGNQDSEDAVNGNDQSN